MTWQGSASDTTPAKHLDALLAGIYRSFSGVAREIRHELACRLSPPLLLSVPDAWVKSTARILLMGQETGTWIWAKGDKRYSWPFAPLRQLGDFVANEDAVAALMHAYQLFDFSRASPPNRNSPFWSAYRRVRDSVERKEERSVLWSNVFKVDLDGGSVLRATARELEEVYSLQRGLVREEMRILKPRAVVFFTGPDYDNAVNQAFPSCEWTAIGDHSVRTLARVSHPDLPACALRTYHPSYLRRAGLEAAMLDSIVRQITSEVSVSDIP